MSASIDALQVALVARIATIADDLGKAEAQVICDRYIAALTAQTNLSDGELASYTIAGRTITLKNQNEGEAILRVLRSELNQYIGGNIVVHMGEAP